MFSTKSALPFTVFCTSSNCGRPLQELGLDAPRPLNAAQTTVAVNAVNGNALVCDKAFVIADDGLSLSLGMLWNSADKEWRLAAGAVQCRFDAQSNSVWFTEEDGRITSESSIDDRGVSIVTKTSDGITRVFASDGVCEHYNLEGQLDYKACPNGQRLDYHYDDAGKLISINLPSGRSIDVRAGIKLIDEKGIAQTLCEYQIDNGSLTTKIRQPDGSDYVTLYVNAEDKLIINSSDATKQELEFSCHGELKSLQEGARLWRVARDSNAQTFDVSNNDQNILSAGYDKDGHWQSLKQAGETQPVKYVCDAEGRIRNKTHADGAIDKYGYDDVTGLLNLQSNSKSKLEITRTFEQDKASPNFGVVKAETTKDNDVSATTTFEHTAQRQLECKTSAAGRKQEYGYDKEKPYRLREVRQGNVRQFGYDRYGRRDSEKVLAGEKVLESTSKTFDAIGRTIETRASDDHIFVKEYDGLDRIILLQENERQEVTRYHGERVTTTKVNDLVVESIKDAGCLTVSETEKIGNVERKDEIILLVDGRVDRVEHADGRVTQYTYGANGRLQQQVTDGEAVCEYLYDKRDRLIGKKRYDTASPERALTTYAFLDADDQLRFEVTVKPVKNPDSTTELKGYVTEHRYQLSNRVMTIQSAEMLTGKWLDTLDLDFLLVHAEFDESPQDRITRNQYDLDGNLTREWVQTEAEGSLGFAKDYIYDEANNRTHEFIYLDKSTHDADLAGKPALCTRHWYDAAGRKVATLDGDGYLVAFAYDQAGNMVCETRYAVSIKLDINANTIVLPSVSDDDIVIKHDFDKYNREFRTYFSNTALEVTREFDKSDHVILETKTDTKTGEVRQTRSKYNAYGDVIAVASEIVCASTTAKDDENQWLQSEFHPVTGLCLYKSDEFGHKTYYLYDKNRKPVLVISPDNVVVKMRYDNVTGKCTEIYTFATRLSEFVYAGGDGFFDSDKHQSLIPCEHEDDRKLTCRYDAEGLLIEKINPNLTRETRLYNAFSELSESKKEIEIGKTLHKKFLHDLRGNVVESVVDPDKLDIKTSAKFDDALNRETEKINELGLQYNIKYNGLREKIVKDNDDAERVKTVKQDAFNRLSSETDWTNLNDYKHEYQHAERKHTVVHVGNVGRQSSDVTNAFGEVTSTIKSNVTTVHKHDLAKNANETTYADGTSDSDKYDMRGHLQKKTSVLGLKTDYIVGAGGGLDAVIEDADGEKLEAITKYNAFGELNTAKDATGLTVKYRYTASNRTYEEVIDPDGLGLIRTQVKNANGDIVKTSQGDADDQRMYHDEATCDVLGRELSLKIFDGDKLRFTVHETEYDNAGNAVVVKDGEGNATRHVYDRRGNVRFTVDAERFVTEKVYDKNDRVIKAKRFEMALPPQKVSELDEGETLSVLMEWMSTASYNGVDKIYDVDGLLLYDVNLLDNYGEDKRAAITAYQYDDAMNRTQILTYASAIPYDDTKLDSLPVLLKKAEYVNNELNRKVNYEHDALGRVRFEHYDDGAVIEHRYDAAGNEVALIKSSTVAIYTIYDKFGRERFSIDPAGYVKETRYNKVHIATDDIRYARKLNELLKPDEMVKLIELLGEQGVSRRQNEVLEQMTTIASLLESNNDVHLVNVLDVAHRVIGHIDGEGKAETLVLNALDLCVERVDKNKHRWVNKFNCAKKLESALTPIVEVTLVNHDETNDKLTSDVVLTPIETKQEYDSAQNISKTLRAANIEREVRAVATRHDAKGDASCATIEKTIIDDGSLECPTIDGIYTREAKLETKTIRDYDGREIVVSADQGKPGDATYNFIVYDALGRVCYTIDAEGYVTEKQYKNVFNEPAKVTRFSVKMMSDFLKDYYSTGIPLSVMREKSKELVSDNDRTVTYAYDCHGRKTSETQGESYVVGITDTDDHLDPKVHKFARKIIIKYDFHGNIVEERRSNVSGSPDSVARYFYDLNGNRIASISPRGYLVLYHYGMPNCNEEKGESILEFKIEFKKRIKEQYRASLQDALLHIQHIGRYVKTTYKYDKRHLLISEKVTDNDSSAHPYYESDMGEDQKLHLTELDKMSETKTEYDAEGQPIVYVNFYGESRHVIRDELGRVIWDIGYPIRLLADSKETVRPVKSYGYNAHGQIARTCTYALAADLKFDEDNKIILDGLVKHSDLDEESLAYHDNRGLIVFGYSSTEGMSYYTHDALRNMIRRLHRATVYRLDNTGKPATDQFVRSERNVRNNRGDVTMRQYADGHDEISTYYKINAFGECTDEGPSPDLFYVHERFDNAGNKWFSNKNRLIATISFYDAENNETLTFRSLLRDLHKYLNDGGLDAAKVDLADTDHQAIFHDVNRYVTHRHGDKVISEAPWRRERAAFAPTHIPVVYSVVQNPAPELPGHYICFKAPDEKFLQMDFKLRLKGEKKWQKPDIIEKNLEKNDGGYCYVNVEDFSADEYEYCLDFYRTSIVPATTKTDTPVLQRDALPCYRSDGDVMLDTGKYAKSSKAIWYMQDNATLVIAGKCNDVHGVELVKDGNTTKRIAGTRQPDGRLIVDLSREESADYDFKFVIGANVLAENLQPGSSVNFPVSVYQPTFNITSLNSVSLVSGSLPPEMANVSYEFVAAIMPPFPVTYKYPQGLARRVFIKAIDDLGNHFYLGEIFFTDEMIGHNVSLPPISVFKTNGVTQVHGILLNGSEMQVMTWGSHANFKLCRSNMISGNRVDVFGLDGSGVSETVQGRISVNGNESGQLLEMKEVAITGFEIDAYNFTVKRKYDRDYPTYEGFYYSWSSTLSPGYHLHIHHDRVEIDLTDISLMPTNYAGDRIYYQAMQIIDANYSPNNVTLHLQVDGDSIPLCTEQRPTQVVTVPDYDRLRYNFHPAPGHIICKYGRDHVHDRFVAVKPIQKSNYPDMHVMYFKGLPVGTDKITLDYKYTTTLGDQDWRPLSFQKTNNGLAFNIDSIPPGVYACRFQAFDTNGKLIIINNSRFRHEGDFYHFTMPVRKGAPHCQSFVSEPKRILINVKKPRRIDKFDYRDNRVKITDRCGTVIKQKFNAKNEVVQRSTPVVDVTSNCDVTTRQALTTTLRRNKGNAVVAEIAPDATIKMALVNSRGEKLCEEDADGVQFRHSYNLLRQAVSSSHQTAGVITSSFRRVGSLLVETRLHSNGACEEITTNEEHHVIKRKDRMADVNNPDELKYFCPDAEGRNRLTIYPKAILAAAISHSIEEDDFHPRSGAHTRHVDRNGGVQAWGVREAELADGYIGNISTHTNLAGKTIHYQLNFNKQIICEIGDLADFLNYLESGSRSSNGTPLNHRYIVYDRDEIGRVTDIIDNGVQVTSSMQYDEEDYCTSYYFIGHNGRVYQATNTTYDELHRIKQMTDTHMMIKIGYDEKSNRRYAKAFLIGDNIEEQPLFHDSWFDYSPAGRTTLRDCVLGVAGIQLKQGQGVAIEYGKEKHNLGRVEKQSTITSEGQRDVYPWYQVGDVVNNLVIKINGEVVETESRASIDAGDRVTRRVTEDKKNNTTIEQVIVLDRDDSIISQETTKTKDGKQIFHEQRRVDLRKETGHPLQETVVSTYGIARGVDVTVTDIVTTKYHDADSSTVESVTTERIKILLSGKNSKDYKIKDGDLHKPQTIVVTYDVNDNQTGVGPTAKTDPHVFPEGYREFVRNSEGCVLLKENIKGRNYYFYAQKRPDNTVLLAYFGDIPDDLKRGLMAKSIYHPTELNIDVDNEPFSSSYPPSCPGTVTADGTKTYRQIAAENHRAGYEVAIAWANNADPDNVPVAGTQVVIPSLAAVLAETADSGSIPSIEMLLGSMYPALAAPAIEVRPPHINWTLMAAEAAIAATVTVVTLGAAAPAAASVLYAVMAGAGAAMAADVAVQETAMIVGAQHGFNYKQTVMAGAVGGLTGGVGNILGVGPSAGKAAGEQLGKHAMVNAAKNVATAETGALTQQGMEVVMGTRKQVDIRGLAVSALGGAISSGVNAKFADNKWVSAGVYTAATTVGDTLIRGQSINTTSLSASIIGAMLGSYAGNEVLHYSQAQQQEHAQEQKARQAPRHHFAPRAPALAPRRGAQHGSMLAKGYEQGRRYGYARNVAVFWSARDGSAPVPPTVAAQASESASSSRGRYLPTPAPGGVAIPHDVAVGAMEELGIMAVGAAGILLLPESVTAVLGSIATAMVTGPIGDMAVVDALGSSVVLRASVGGLAAKMGMFGGGGVSEAAEKIVQLLESPKDNLLRSVQNMRLRNITARMYREKATVGAGSTADAIRYELKTGNLLSPSGHLQKGVEMRAALSKLIKSGELSKSDLILARWMRRDIQDALSQENISTLLMKNK